MPLSLACGNQFNDHQLEGYIHICFSLLGNDRRHTKEVGNGSSRDDFDSSKMGHKTMVLFTIGSTNTSNNRVTSNKRPSETITLQMINIRTLRLSGKVWRD